MGEQPSTTPTPTNIIIHTNEKQPPVVIHFNVDKGEKDRTITTVRSYFMTRMLDAIFGAFLCSLCLLALSASAYLMFLAKSP